MKRSESTPWQQSRAPAFQRVTDYERLYRQKREVCGEPFPEIAEWFRREFTEPVRVLDLGCGQGRDALVLARLGHQVTGIDLAPSGIAALMEDARREGLEDRIEARAGDFEGVWPEGPFDVILLDRVLNMLPDDSQRRLLLERALDALPPGGHLVIAVTVGGVRLTEAFLAASAPMATSTQLGKGIWCARRR